MTIGEQMATDYGTGEVTEIISVDGVQKVGVLTVTTAGGGEGEPNVVVTVYIAAPGAEG